MNAMFNFNNTNKKNKPLLIVAMGHTFESIENQIGDFDQWIKQVIQDDTAVTVDPRLHSMPDPELFSGIILTGSHDMVTERAVWSEQVAEWLHLCRDKHCPVLGICYGHQLIAQTFGGIVGDHPKGFELGTHRIQCCSIAEKDHIFSGFPKSFDANLVHYQTVLQLPKDAVLLASNEHEPHQAYRLDDCIWGVQFHPEFQTSPMQHYLDVLRHDLDEALLNQVIIRETPYAQQILINFKQYCETRLAFMS